MDAPSVQAIVGSALGILGGVVGTYFGIKNTKSPRERRLAVRASLICWGVLGLAALAAFLMPSLRPWALVPICVLAIFGPAWLNRRLTLIQRDDRCER